MTQERNSHENNIFEENVLAEDRAIQESDGNEDFIPQKVTVSDAKLFLENGKMGYVFIGIVIGFFLLTALTSFIHLPLIVYLIIVLLAAPFVYIYYLHIHRNDEDKLD